MGKLFLIHWNDGEAEALAAPLQETSWQVEIESEDGAGEKVAKVKAAVPDALYLASADVPGALSQLEKAAAA